MSEIKIINEETLEQRLEAMRGNPCKDHPGGVGNPSGSRERGQHGAE